MGGPAEPEGVAARVRDELRRTVAALSTLTEVPCGWVARCDELALVHTLNQVHVSSPCASDDAWAAADAHLPHLPYRHLVVDAPQAASALLGDLRGATVSREVLMALGAPDPRPVDTSRVVELTEDEAAVLMRRWLDEDGTDTTPGALDQLVEYGRREGRLFYERRFGVLHAGATPVALTKLRTDGAGTAWVEDVYTVPEARGQGHARTLVTHAVRLAIAERHELCFIIADDQDWPKDLYAGIGFRPVGLRWAFHRVLGPHGQAQADA